MNLLKAGRRRRVGKEEQMNLFKGSDSITSPSSLTNYSAILHGYFKP